MFKNFMNEFKEFALRGNVLDLAVGVVIGGAFSAIVTSLVKNIITPLIGIILGGHDVSGLMVKVGTAELKYGAFLQSIIDFVIIAFAIFIFIKAINTLTTKFKKPTEETTEEPTIEASEEYLKEIRDLLALQAKNNHTN
ncbi:large conductance mechanosensitive channel protein MscL [Carnobacterium divergens]|uniref:Large-conductance mechanosensitive channel n=1 Tax=Carnobacterium divergens DSM 20623 TaxID=1449336 RepID=A0A0R2I6B5_CARDV|nr:large conductance mechanosensitive channel protein MscL [Carnobacterium divergens]AOA00815.1 mechanosensitive ion channel protein MscL [Carnobacterium divergens]KRN58037.1 large conductance mechanosensitive channel protein [Carnobacterium divergens DSM 20623]MDO0874665.1 large conductance mechanosensitive channel protein MscL [Carnobacterium divergens]MDT1997361.1 large conductance mechanosensitive channel protein MscL [Carnobacterium divergens]MDT2012741.1 large conductance mechanosensitiv